MTPCVFVIVIVHLQMVGGEQCIIGMGIMLITSHHLGERTHKTRHLRNTLYQDQHKMDPCNCDGSSRFTAQYS